MRQRTVIAPVIGFALLLVASSLSAHHSFAAIFDGDKVVKRKGVVTGFQWANPHTFIFVESKGTDGSVEGWALEGPNPNQLARRNIDKESFKVGDSIEFCGYGTKEGIDPVRSTPEPISLSLKSNPRPSGHLISAELLTTSNGQKLTWAGYGQRKCLDPQ